MKKTIFALATAATLAVGHPERPDHRRSPLLRLRGRRGCCSRRDRRRHHRRRDRQQRRRLSGLRAGPRLRRVPGLWCALSGWLPGWLLGPPAAA